MTSPQILPTVGRVVWFYPSSNTGESGFARHADGGPYAALIAHVWGDSLVNLCVFDANGAAHPRTSVTLEHGDQPINAENMRCEWMPYQKGQATKAETVKEAIAPSSSWDKDESTRRAELEYTLVSGAASHIANEPHKARLIAEGIKVVLDALHPAPSTPASSLASAKLCTCGPGSGCTNCPSASKLVELPVVEQGADSRDREIQAKASAGPRVTPADIEANIASEHYFTAADGVQGAYRAGDDVHPVGGTPSQATHKTLGLLTFCVLVLRNGTKVVGINYGAIDPAQHNAIQGRDEARKEAVEKVWELLGFRLRDNIHNLANGPASTTSHDSPDA